MQPRWISASEALLFGAGLAGGVANAMAGGATLITFPAILASTAMTIVYAWRDWL